MKISRTATYAVEALLLLGQYGGDAPTPCSKLARDGNMPERFLLQILRELVNGGILESVRGVDGGYRLARSPAEITLDEVIEAVEGPLLATIRVHDGPPSPAGRKLAEIYRSVSCVVREELSKVTLLEMASVPSEAASGGENLHAV